MKRITNPIKINFTDFWTSDPDFYKEWWVYKILEKNFTLEISDKPDILFFSVHGEKHFSYNCHKIEYIDEPVSPRSWCADFAISFDHTDDPRHLRLPNYVWWFTPEFTLDMLLQPKSPHDLELLKQRKNKFCCFIVSNHGGKERNAFFTKLSEYKKVDSAGRYLNNIGYNLGHKIGDKLEFMRDYKFSLAFENSFVPGYTTEKILNAKQADTIPIYWGNPDIDKEMNPKSFINYNDYNSFDKLMDRVIEVDNNDDLYFQYLREPLFHNGVPNEYFDEERIVTFFEKVISSLGKPPVSSTNLYYKSYKLKMDASRTPMWNAARSVYKKIADYLPNTGNKRF